MKGYIVGIAGGAILAAFADIFSPSGWKKYISVVTGIILITIILKPIADFKNADILSAYTEFNDNAAADGEQIYSDMLKKEFSKKVAADIKERISMEFEKDVSVEVIVEMNDGGGIKKIDKIIIGGIDEDKKITERISYVYDVDEVVYNVAG